MGEPVTRTLSLPDEAATVKLGELLAQQLPGDVSGRLLLLQGELGAGKSTLARSFIHSLGHAGPVPSPTYTLVEPYALAAGPVYHVDLYRVGSEDELEFLGWDELADGLALVEWPERVPSLLAKADLHAELRYVPQGRAVALRAATRRGEAWLAGLALTADDRSSAS